MTQKLKNIIQLLLSFDDLPEEEQDAIANHVSNAIEEVKNVTDEINEPVTPIKQRIPGLEAGKPYYIADDFDDPLPDSFWLGES